MTASTRKTVLSLYMRVFRIARTWQAQSGVANDTDTERKYILQEARSLFRQNQQMTDQESIKKCIEECEARIEIGLHYRNPYPRPTYLPPLGLATQKGRKLRAQQRLRKQAKPIYLQSHDETWCSISLILAKSSSYQGQETRVQSQADLMGWVIVSAPCCKIARHSGKSQFSSSFFLL